MKRKILRHMQKMSRVALLGVLAAAISVGGSLPTAFAATSYETVTETFDWGPSVSKVVVDVDRDVKAGDVDASKFRAHVKRVLAVTAAYVSDAQGNKVADGQSGHYVTLEMKVGPQETLGAALNFDLRSFLNNWVTSEYTITDEAANATIDNCKGDIRPQADKFTYGVGTGEEARLSFPYASYEPESLNDGSKHPLIIWLHGMGEGGNSPSLPIMGNKATQFADASIQKHFGGAYVLAPQARTYWMHGYKTFADGTSIYSQDLMAFIKNYVAAHPGVDENRIYVGGDSNGGYMTMLLVRDNPGYFAAAFPTCEGLADKLISDKDLKNIAKTPIWFTAAKTDTVLPPKDYVVPTFARLQKIGADAHFSFFDKVVDETGLYKKADGTPYEYAGHWSWIYVYNDRCEDTINGKAVKLFDWMAAQHR